MNHNINGEKLLNDNLFLGYQKVYFWTNENILGSLEVSDLSNYQKALVVEGSGDHALNLINYGLKDITMFDINLLTEYYIFGIKIPAIMKYNYKEFLKFMEELYSSKTPNKRIGELIIKILPFMEGKYQIFWLDILAFNYKIQKKYKTNINLFDMLCIKLDKKSILF